MKKRLFSMALAALLVVSAIAPAAANAAVNDAGHIVGSTQATEYYEAMTKDADFVSESKQCDVDATVGTSFIITIPKRITLGGAGDTKGKGVYTVTVDADLAGTEYISVAPVADDTAFKLAEQGGKADIDYTVTQEKQWFIALGSDNVDGTATAPAKQIELSLDAIDGYVRTNAEAIRVPGAVSAPQISAGTWKGTFNFAIGLNIKTAPATPAENPVVGE